MTRGAKWGDRGGWGRNRSWRNHRDVRDVQVAVPSSQRAGTTPPVPLGPPTHPFGSPTAPRATFGANREDFHLLRLRSQVWGLGNRGRLSGRPFYSLNLLLSLRLSGSSLFWHLRSQRIIPIKMGNFTNLANLADLINLGFIPFGFGCPLIKGPKLEVLRGLISVDG